MPLNAYKTIFEYHLPPPIAERALRNATAQLVGWRTTIKPEVQSIDNNLMDSFNWSCTPERSCFWGDVFEAVHGRCEFPSVKSLR